MHAERILDYHFNLLTQSSKINLPRGIKWLFPYDSEETRHVMEEYYQTYFNDEKPRTLLFGINPGRFGSGLTGVPFTDPIRLQTECGIKNSFPKKPEISAEFIHLMITKLGGLEQFNRTFYITSLCPLGFIKEGINFNYYDDKTLQLKVTKFIRCNIESQIELVNGNRQKAYCLGEGKNYTFFKKLNDDFRFFNEIIPLPHPRWIMQYRRKRVQEFLELYFVRLHQSST